jgi:hypothetical protein
MSALFRPMPIGAPRAGRRAGRLSVSRAPTGQLTAAATGLIVDGIASARRRLTCWSSRRSTVASAGVPPWRQKRGVVLTCALVPALDELRADQWCGGGWEHAPLASVQLEQRARGGELAHAQRRQGVWAQMPGQCQCGGSSQGGRAETAQTVGQVGVEGRPELGDPAERLGWPSPHRPVCCSREWSIPCYFSRNYGRRFVARLES